jgi:hypothetical protein
MKLLQGMIRSEVWDVRQSRREDTPVPCAYGAAHGTGVSSNCDANNRYDGSC